MDEIPNNAIPLRLDLQCNPDGIGALNTARAVVLHARKIAYQRLKTARNKASRYVKWLKSHTKRSALVRAREQANHELAILFFEGEKQYRLAAECALQDAVQVIQVICGAILRKEFEVDTDLIQRNLEDILETVKSQSLLSISLNSINLEMLKDIGKISSLFRADNSLEPGEVLIETNVGTIKSSWSKSLEESICSLQMKLNPTK